MKANFHPLSPVPKLRLGMRRQRQLFCPSRFRLALVVTALTAVGASAQTDSNPPMTNAPPVPRPHIIEVPQPDQVPTAPASTDHIDPAKVAQYQQRFEQGYALEQAGKLIEARDIYDGILAEEPHARRSLLEAGKISFKLNQLPKADDYLERLHALEPAFPAAIELLIQINQALGRDVKVELLIRDFDALHAAGSNPELSKSLYFVRERITSGTQQIVVSQFFDYGRDPNTVWMAEVFDASGELKRRILLNYDPDATRALQARDAKYAKTQIFTWFEHQIVDQKVTEIDAYLQIFALPDYAKFRSAMQIILANPPTPISVTPIPGAKA